MAWPPPALPVSRTDQTPQLGNHPDDHNLANQAINDIVGQLDKLVSGGLDYQEAQMSTNYTLTGTQEYVGGTYLNFPAVPYTRFFVVIQRVAISYPASTPINGAALMAINRRIDATDPWVGIGTSLYMACKDSGTYIDDQYRVELTTVPASQRVEFRIYGSSTTASALQVVASRTKLTAIAIPKF